MAHYNSRQDILNVNLVNINIILLIMMPTGSYTDERFDFCNNHFYAASNFIGDEGLKELCTKNT